MICAISSLYDISCIAHLVSVGFFLNSFGLFVGFVFLSFFVEFRMCFFRSLALWYCLQRVYFLISYEIIGKPTWVMRTEIEAAGEANKCSPFFSLSSWHQHRIDFKFSLANDEYLILFFFLSIFQLYWKYLIHSQNWKHMVCSLEWKPLISK